MKRIKNLVLLLLLAVASTVNAQDAPSPQIEPTVENTDTVAKHRNIIQKIVDYVLAFDAELKKLMAPIGNSSLPVGRSDALVSTDKAIADKLGIQYVC